MIANKMGVSFLKWTLLGLGGMLVNSAQAMTINAVYDSSVTVAEKNAFAAVVNLFDNTFNNAMVMTINVSTLATTSYLGSTSSNLMLYGNSATDYNTMVGSLQNANKNLVLPSYSNIFNAPVQTLGLTNTEAKALGLINAKDQGVDGSITFSSSYKWSTDTSTTALLATDQYDFIGVAEHEVSELMGRLSGLKSGIGYITPLDMLRYSGNAPTGALNYATNVANGPYYLSLDGGKTRLVNLNASGTGDLGDFSSSDNTDPFNAVSLPGQVNRLNSNDLAVMQALGYSVKTSANSLSSVPLPSAFWLFISVVCGWRIFNKKNITHLSAI